MIKDLKIGRPETYLPKEIGKEGQNETKPGPPNPCVCCGNDATGNQMWYYYNNKLICFGCRNDISEFEKELGPILYDDFDKWNLLADRFPKIFERDFYKKPEVRERLKLPPLK